MACNHGFLKHSKKSGIVLKSHFLTCVHQSLPQQHMLPSIFPVPRDPDDPHSLPDTEAKALLKERQKKDNHNLSE